MCVISNIGDMGRSWWPQTPEPIYTPGVTAPSITFERVPTKEEWDAFLEIVEKARQFDEISGQPDCEDPEKTGWFEAMSAAVDDLQERVLEVERWREHIAQ